MSVIKRGKYWVVQFNHNNRTYTRSTKSTRKRDALELERQMRQQLVETQILGHREHIKLYEACDALPTTSKESGAYSSLRTAVNRFKDRSRVANNDFIPMTIRLRICLENRRRVVDGDYVFPGRYGGHKTIQNNRALEAAFRRFQARGVDRCVVAQLEEDVCDEAIESGRCDHRCAALAWAFVRKTTERSYSAFIKNERFKQAINLLDEPRKTELTVVN